MPDMPDIPTWQDILISQIVAGLTRNYIFPDKIDENFEKKLRDQFKAKFSGPEYLIEPGKDGKEFASQVGIILKDLVRDEHLELFYGPALISTHEDFLRAELKFPWELPLSDPRNFPEALKAVERTELIEIGCGYYDMETNPEFVTRKMPEARKADRLAELERYRQVKIPEDIGYVGLAFVADPITFPVVGEKIFDIMYSMRGKKAIIIDLRGNTGGAPEGARHLLSYLLEQPTHYNTIRKRSDGKLTDEEFRTYDRSSEKLIPVTRPVENAPDLSDKPIYVLIDKNTFSAGEEIAYDLQQLGRAILIGEKTRGGAHPMRQSPLFIDAAGGVNKSFYIAVPDSTAVNPKTGTNWEDHFDGDKGIRPDIPVVAEMALQMAVDEIGKLAGPCVHNPVTVMRDLAISPPLASSISLSEVFCKVPDLLREEIKQVFVINSDSLRGGDINPILRGLRQLYMHYHPDKHDRVKQPGYDELQAIIEKLRNSGDSSIQTEILQILDRPTGPRPRM
ncbi:MAG: S41 family peptidase [Rickettsiaceae bacterium]|nr:S41 family peptidase [Rickettsiaceae bacterium]